MLRDHYLAFIIQNPHSTSTYRGEACGAVRQEHKYDHHVDRPLGSPAGPEPGGKVIIYISWRLTGCAPILTGNFPPDLFLKLGVDCLRIQFF